MPNLRLRYESIEQAEAQLSHISELLQPCLLLDKFERLGRSIGANEVVRTIKWI